MFLMWNLRIGDGAERRLAQRAWSGDRDAGEQIVRRHYASVYRFAFALSHDREAAEEITQATFAACWESLKGFEGASSLRTWIHRIAYRQYTRWLSQKSRNPVAATMESEPFLEPDMVQSLWLHAAIDKLPDNHREAFVLFYLQDLSVNEVAEILQIPKGTVLSRLHESRARLRKLLTIREANPQDDPIYLPKTKGHKEHEMRKASI